MTSTKVSGFAASGVVLLLAAFIVLAAFPHAAFAQADPRMGTWKLNLAKSTYNPGPPPKSSIYKFEPSDGGFKVTNDSVPAQGQPTHSEIVAKFDGKSYVLSGNPAGPISRVYKRVDARTVESQDKFKDALSFKRTEVVSADGKTMTVTITGPNLQGVVTNNLLVYDKQ